MKLDPGFRQNGDIEICHCYGCRHTSGQLYTSYYKLDELDISDQVLTKYSLAPQAETGSLDLYFCSKCGCHVFRAATNDNTTTVEVATGTIISGDDGTEPDDNKAAVDFGPQLNTGATADGGISIWMPFMRHSEQETAVHGPNITDTTISKADGTHTQASCLCGGLQLRISPPNEDSTTPHSGYADLIMPFHSGNPDIKNPNDEKWWLRQNKTKYLAGLCACQSCRLASGFELQSWAFVPRLNIEYCIPSTDGDGDAAKAWRGLDFDALHAAGVLRSYKSSPGVLRDFCPTCGATSFWHDEWRPDLIDVSVGLFNSAHGARVESLLDWWTSRISFAEDATLGRTGSGAVRADQLVKEVETCMKEYAKGRSEKV